MRQTGAAREICLSAYIQFAGVAWYCQVGRGVQNEAYLGRVTRLPLSGKGMALKVIRWKAAEFQQVLFSRELLRARSMRCCKILSARRSSRLNFVVAVGCAGSVGRSCCPRLRLSRVGERLGLRQQPSQRLGRCK